MRRRLWSAPVVGGGPPVFAGLQSAGCGVRTGRSQGESKPVKPSQTKFRLNLGKNPYHWIQLATESRFWRCKWLKARVLQNAPMKKGRKSAKVRQSSLKRGGGPSNAECRMRSRSIMEMTDAAAPRPTSESERRTVWVGLGRAKMPGSAEKCDGLRRVSWQSIRPA